MFCDKCGNKLNDGDKFCEKCGSPVTVPEEPIAAAVVPDGGEAVSEAGPGAEAVSGGQGAAVSGDEVPNLEKKIMKNMEDELILEAGAAGASYGGYQGGQSQAGAHGGNGPVEYGYAGGNGQAHHNMHGSAGQNPYGGQQPPEYEYIGGNKKPEKKKSKKKKALIITLVSVLAAAIIALAVAAFLLSNPMNKFKSAIRDRDWTRAESLYEDKFEGNEKKEAKADELLKEEVEKLKSAYASGEMDYQNVKRHLTAIEDFWDDSCVEVALEEIRGLYDSRSAFEEGEAAMKSGDYSGAIEAYQGVVSSDPNYDKAQEQLKTAKSKYKEEVLSSAAAYEELKDYEAAIEEIEDALEVLPGDSGLQSRLSELEAAAESNEIASVLSQCETYAAQENYYGAMEELEDALELHPGNTELQNALTDYSTQYQTYMLKKAEEALGSDKNYETAIIVLDGALDTLGGDYPEIEQVLREKREEYVQAQLSQSQAANEASDIVGTWRGTWVRGGMTDMAASYFLMISGFDEDQMMLKMSADGGLYVQLIGETGNGTWQKGSGNTYILDVEGDTQEVTVKNGELTMDMDGIILVFEKDGAA